MSGAVAGPCDTGIAVAAVRCSTPHPGATLAATILGSSVAFIDGSVVSVALPAIAGDLSASSAELSWTINAYLLPLGALMLLGGGAGDHFGRRRLSSLDWAGAGLATLALGLLTWSLTAAATASAPATWRWLAAVAGFVLFGVFLRVERKRGQEAIMPLSMFATKTFIGITLLTFF